MQSIRTTFDATDDVVDVKASIVGAMTDSLWA